MAFPEFAAPEFASSVAAAKTRVRGLQHVADLGAGSIGRVVLAADPLTRERFVVKRILLGDDASTVERAAQEARVCRSMHHPCIPTYLAALADTSSSSLVMQYAEGCSLLPVIRSCGGGGGGGGVGLPECSVRSIVQQLVEVLEYLHGEGLVYVDLKAENVLLLSTDGQQLPPAAGPNPDPQRAALDALLPRLQNPGANSGCNIRIQLLDYDLCKRLDSNSTSTEQGSNTAEEQRLLCPGVAGSSTLNSTGGAATAASPPLFWGTLDYVAPEVIERGLVGYSAASDWWSLGILTYECLFGCSPFIAPSQERTFYNITMKAPTFPPQPQVSQHCQYFIRSLLRQRVEFRLGTKGGGRELLQHPFLSTGPQGG